MRGECATFAERLTGLFSDIVAEAMTVRLLRELDDLDITLSQLQALTLIAERRKSSIGAIAAGLGVTHPAAVKLVDKLSRKGLVSRGVDPNDHRTSEIAVTPEGLALVRDARQERTRRLAQVLDRMPAADRQALIQGLEAFVTAALRDGQALDQLCVSCQTVLPSDCESFLVISGAPLATTATAETAAG